MFFDFYRHVLPRNSDGSVSEAFRLEDGTVHKNLYVGLSQFPADLKEEADRLFLDIFPQTTRALDEWSEAFDLWPSPRTDQETRDLIDAHWKATGGQSPKYLQDLLQSFGFNVFVHDWWGAELPIDTTIFDFDERCYFADGIFPGTSEFTEGRITRAWKERDGAIVEFDAGVIRDGHDNGLLVEPTRTQLIRNPVDMTKATWVKSGTLTVIREAIFDPLLVEKSNRVSPGGVNDRLEQFVEVTPETDYVVSWYVRNIDATDVSYLIYDQTNAAEIIGETSYFSQISDSDFTRIEVPFTTPVGCTEVRLQIARSLTGGDIYADVAQFEQGTFATSPIVFGDGILKSSVNVVKTLTYDTRYDSDGGAWRSRTSGTSWYNETLNTATRGATREFPERASIVAETDTVTIYDTTRPGNPMWMVFDASQGRYVYNAFGSNLITSIDAKDGRLCVSVGGSTLGGLGVIDFIEDYGYLQINNTNEFNGNNIENRNIVQSDVITGVRPALVNRQVNDVAITARADAETDPATFLPYLTIGVVTDGGVSVINHDGTATNENVVTDSLSTAKGLTVSFTQDDEVVYQNNVGSRVQVSSDYSFDGFPVSRTYDLTSIPAVLGPPQGSAVSPDVIYARSSSGLSRMIEDLTTPTNGIVDYVTKDWVSGHMQGDIRGAWITEKGSGVELFPDGTFSSGVSQITPLPDGSVVSDAGGVLEVTSNGAFGAGYIALSTEVGKPYMVTWDVLLGNGRLRAGPSPNSSALLNKVINAVSSGREVFVATNTTTYLNFGTGGATDTAQFDNVSVVEVETIGGELVTNGTFDADTDWTKGTGWSIGSGVASCDGSQASASNLFQSSSITLGETYACTFTVSNRSAGSVRLLAGAGSSGTFVSANGTYTEYLVATSNTNIIVQADGNFVGDVDNVSVVPVVEDRSVKGNDLAIQGTLTQGVVAPGADLTAISGFSANDCLWSPPNTDFDYGTGDFYVIGWVKTSATGIQYWVERSIPSSTRFIECLIDSSGNPAFKPGSDATITGPSSIRDGLWHQVVCSRSSGSSYLYVDRVLVASGSSSSSVSNASAELGVGCRAFDPANSPFGGSLSLIRTGAGAPTAEQIELMYDFESTWFEPDAKITLGGSSNAITDISYDFVRNEAYVTTSDGVTVFDLATRKRIDFITDEVATSVNHVSVSAVDGFMTAGTTAEAYVESDQGVRGADDVTIQDLDTLDWFTNASEFTVVATAILNGKTNSTCDLISFSDGTTDNEATIYIDATDNPSFRVVSGTVSQADVQSGVAITEGTAYNVVIRVQQDALSISVDGAAVVTDASGSVPVGLDRILFGASDAAQNIVDFQYLPRALTDDEMVTYSTNGPDGCVPLDPRTVNPIGTEYSPYTGECGEPDAVCGDEILSGDKVIIQPGEYPPIRNPLTVLNDENHIAYTATVGDPGVSCGLGFECNGTYPLDGYPLVNNIIEQVPGYANIILAGEEGVECGEPLVQCGEISGFTFTDKQYIIPSDVLKWPHFVYVGGETWPELAQVDADRRDEFETVILKYFPAHKWVGVLVEYV